MVLPQQAVDWQKTTQGVPYVWSEQEHIQIELSETFFPGDLTQLGQFRTALLQIFPMSLASQKLLTQQFNDCPLHYSQTNQNFHAVDIVTNDMIIQQCQVLLETHEKNPDLAKTIINAFIGFALGVPPQLDNPTLPFKPDITVSRLLRLSQIPDLMNAISEVFKYNCEICSLYLQNPPSDSNATKQLSPLLVVSNQLLHCIISVCLHKKIQPALPKSVIPQKYYTEVLKAAINLFNHLSGISPEHIQIVTFTVPNARCFATSRVICLIRQVLQFNLGDIGDMKAAENLRETKRVSEFNEKQIKRLPCPRFFGFVNQQSPQIQLLETYMQSNSGTMNYPTPFFRSGMVKCTYDPANYQKEIDDNNNLFFQHMQKINQKRRSMIGQGQECDALTLRKEVNYQKIFQTFPEVPLKGAIEGLEQAHGAYLAMRLAVDQRSVNKSFDETRSTSGGMSGNQYNTGTVRFNGAPQKQDDQILDSSVTTLYKDRVESGLTKPFNYSGRPEMCQQVENQVFGSLQLNNKGYNFDLKRIEQKLTDLTPLDLQSTLLERQKMKTSFLAELMNQTDFFVFIEALGRLGLCSIPNSYECIFNRHSMPEPNAVFTNSNSASIRHIREIVSKSVIHILLIFIYHSKQENLSLHRYMARLYSRVSAVMQTISCLLCLPMGTYASMQDQRDCQYGMNLFANKEAELQTFTADELNADCSEFLFQKKQEIDSTKPLRSFSCARRLFIAITACKVAYGVVMHSRARQVEFARAYAQYSANYLSALQQIFQGQQPQQNPEDENFALQQTLKLSKLVRGFDYYEPIQLRTQQQNQKLITFVPTNILNIIEFLSGANQQNNPGRSNMTATVQSSFPGWQLSKINNASALVTFLKLALHLLPEIQTDQYASAFEVPQLAQSRDAAIRLAYLTGLSNNSVDISRWTKEAAFQALKEKDYLELRSIISQLTGTIRSALLVWLHDENMSLRRDFEETIIDSQLGRV